MDINKKLEDIWRESTDIGFHNEDELNSYSGSLYHYTTAGGLIGILQSQKFWASEYSFLNDASEIAYGKKLADKVLSDFIIDKEYWFSLIVDVALEGLKHLTSREIYIACFCENGDLLSQWKGYSKFGEGYSIGINSNQLSRFKRKSPYVFIDIRKVIYDPKEQTSIIINWLDKMYNKSKELILAYPDHQDKIVKNVGMLISHYLDMQLVRFKHESFKEEAEWRAIFINDNIFEKRFDTKFREANGEIVPYVELDIAPSAQKKEWFLPITDIIVGPKVDVEKALTSISLIYKQLDTEVPDITPSSIPLQ